MKTTAPIAPIQQADVERLERLYVIRGRDEVLQFLQDRQFLLPELFTLPELIQHYFPDVPLSLQFHLDPEEPGLDHLHVGIPTNLAIEPALDQLERLEEYWWPGKDPDMLMHLLVDVEPATAGAWDRLDPARKEETELARRLKPAPIADVDRQTNGVSPADLARLEELYGFREHDTVVDWLEKYPFLIPLLLEGYDQMRRQFPDAPISLQIVYDPEDAKLTELVAYIATDLNDDEALKRLYRIGEDWWLHVISQADLKMDIDVEFR